jgi:hypothetical protein
MTDIDYKKKAENFKNSIEFRRFKSVKDEIFNMKNVRGAGLDSKVGEEIVIAVYLEREDLSFPREMYGFKIRVYY